MTAETRQEEIARHFDGIAGQYDGWKRRNWYYYANLKQLIRDNIPPGKSVLEVGCGTGDILAAANPRRGIGIDVSGNMIRIAREKYRLSANLEFLHAGPGGLPADTSFDYILMVDVVEHITDLEKLFSQLRSAAGSETKLFISMANPCWEPLLLILEKMKMKMAEGAHSRISSGQLARIARSRGFSLEKHAFALLVPAAVPFLSGFINKRFSSIPVVRRLGMIEYMVFGTGK